MFYYKLYSNRVQVHTTKIFNFFNIRKKLLLFFSQTLTILRINDISGVISSYLTNKKKKQRQ